MKTISTRLLRQGVILVIGLATPVVGLATAPKAATLATPAAEAKATAYLENVQKTSGTPALTAAVASKGKIVFSKGAGVADLENHVAARSDTVFNIGSLSKANTAVAVMQLVERGTIRLDDNVRRYVPSFPDKGVPITIRELMSHTSGIRHYRDTDVPDMPVQGNTMAYPTFEQAIALFKDDPLLFTPGKYFFYSSYAVNLLQGVIEEATHAPFETYMKENVWEPSGMTRTSFDVPGRVDDNRARSYHIDKVPPVPIPVYDRTYKFASGGMLSTSEDLVRLGAALNHGRLMKPETVKAMFSPQTSPKLWFRENGPPGHEAYKQALMWRVVNDSAGRTMVYECGSVDGFNACLVNFPQEDLVAAIATNSWGKAGGWKHAVAFADFFRKPRR